MVHRFSAHRPAFSGPRSGARARRQRHFRTRCADRMAYASTRSDAHRHCRMRLGAAPWRARRGDPPRRRGLVLPRRKALARRHTVNRYDTYRNSGKAGWRGCRLDGTGHRPAIPEVNSLPVGVFANILEHLAAGHPRRSRFRINCPAACPGFRISPGVVDRRLISKCLEVSS